MMLQILNITLFNFHIDSISPLFLVKMHWGKFDYMYYNMFKILHFPPMEIDE